ncbi:HD domain-containing phosphohydrolase [Desulfogranum japonicum]|uniref:HD domain-containing phosphohydrolase n=1 Tax=Desulfogranum japonicum TaxID=231447 RepID=UPI0004146B68|nr:HD domain-containing phosphohydrolase [Desulfogranum japonicum]
MNKPLSETVLKWLNTTSDGMIIADELGLMMHANESFFHMTGYDGKDIIGKPIQSLWSKFSAENLGKLKTSLGSYLSVEYQLNKLDFEQDEYIIISLKNISELETLRDELSLEQERMREAKSLAKIGHWELNLITDKLYWSDEVYDMLDLDRADGPPTYATFLNCVHPNDREMVDKVYSNSVKHGTDYNITHRVIVDGGIHYYKEICKTFYDGDIPTKSVGLIQDITEAVIRQEALEKKELELKNTHAAIINVLMEMSDLKDNETGKHVLRTQTYLLKLAKYLKITGKADFSDAYIDLLHQVAPLHDIGKVGIPDHILRKPGKLTADEFEQMKDHTLIGNRVIEKVKNKIGVQGTPYLLAAEKIILYHHEKWDSTGYPMGLQGTHIPLEGRIMALADVYDALRSKRVYKDAMSHEEAKAIIVSETNKHFDPDVVEAFLAIEEEFKKISCELGDTVPA